MADADEWSQAEPYLRDQAYRTIESDPGFLLDREGGPEGLKADIILARLIGHDDQFVKDIRLDRVLPVWRMPMRQPTSIAATDVADLTALPRTAEYVLRSSYVLIELDSQSIWPPDGVTPDPANGFRYTVLFLRYKRRT